MTINLSDNSPRVSYNVAEGVSQSAFVVSFEFFDNDDLNVYVDGTLKTITTDYTVTGGDGSTGTVTFVSAVVGASGGSTVVITRDIDLDRTTDFPSSGPFNIASLNTELDRFVAIAADLKDQADRALQLTDFDAAASLTLPEVDDRKGTVLAFNETTGAVEAGPTTSNVNSLAAVTDDIATLADIEDGTVATNAIQTVSGISSDVTTVSGISANVSTVAGITANIASVVADEADIGTVAGSISNVNTVAGISGNVTTVAGISANVTTVAGVSGNVSTVAGISADVTTAAGISADITTVAADGADIGTVAGISSDVTTVAGISGNVTTVAGQTTNLQNVTDNLSAIQNAATNATSASDSATAAAASAAAAAASADTFDDTYLGSKASDPTVDNDGDALNAGDLYFNTTSNVLKVYNGSAWAAAALDAASFLNTASDATISGTLTLDGLVVDTDTLSVDATNNRVGIGTSSPAGILDVASGDVILQQSNDLKWMNTARDTTYGAIEGLAAGTLFKFGGSEAMRINSSGDVGIGTSSPIRALDVRSGTTDVVANFESSDAGAFISLQDNSTSSDTAVMIGANGDDLRFDAGDVERMRIDSSGRVGIGTSSPDYALEVYSGTASSDVAHFAGGSETTRGLVIGTTVISGRNDAGVIYNANDTSGTHIFQINSSGEAMRIDSSGNVGIGTSSPTSALHISQPSDASSGGLQIRNAADNNSIFIYQNGNVTTYDAGSSGDQAFKTANTERMRIDSSGNVGIGTSLPKGVLDIAGDQPDLVLTATDTSASAGQKMGAINFYNSDPSGDGPNNAAIIEAQHAGSIGNAANLLFKTVVAGSEGGDATEAMRIDSSGNLLVGNTSYNSANVGILNSANGRLFATADGNTPLALNRKTSDGELARFQKDGTTVGSIGSRIGNLYVTFTSNGYGLTGTATNNGIIPSSSGSTVDNVVDLGNGGVRFDDIYATNGTIQTSDQNEKQQIASLTDAEMTAAKAISKLFKTFKWNDSVAEKGDAARTHSGVIAQEVEQAMTDAGLNAGDYAFFISTTWWETQTEVPAVEAVDAVYETVTIPAVEEEVDEEGNVIVEAQPETTEQRLVSEAIEGKEAYTRTDTYDTAEEAPEGATERNRKGIRYPELLSFIGAATEQRLASIESRLDALENA